ncbi:metallophosphoesterase family protein [Sphingopyxis granuli]|uniref:metallophosphoesterase family protein n=1 Tax=Sphingopyxis granuli TaxID=267128 RepID=UPI001BB030D8|nr:metallophosphoesterase family protein [Sphingopyxis granuli]QUM71337.1 serine/threonine protein phosphatase [Sphingopyxis granuli]
MFWKRKSNAPQLARAGCSIPEGRRVYAIGDIHGRDDLFAHMIELIRADHAQRGPAEITLILLGDLVDRGPESAEVIERAMRLRDEFPNMRWLIGNHEECFLAALTGDVRRVRYFMRIGGDATIRSYWRDDASFDEASFEEVAERLQKLVPAEHVDFLGRGENLIEIGDYAFVHAGVRPGVPLEKQALSDLRWIRDEFLDDDRNHGPIIVHGHTIRDDIDEWPNRIGIDTGAYLSGKLTAIGLEGESCWFLKTA